MDEEKKDYVNTILIAVIVLLVIAIFLPPFFRFLNGDTKTVSTGKAAKIECEKEEEIFEGNKNPYKISQKVSISYENNNKKMLVVSFNFPDGFEESASGLSQEIYPLYKDLVSDFSDYSSNGTYRNFRFDLETNKEVLSKNSVQKYTSKSTPDDQMNELTTNKYTCNKTIVG